MLKKVAVHCIIFLIAGSCALAKIQPPVARNGILDLRDYDISHSGPVELNGEWQFAWQHLRYGPDSADVDSLAWINIKVPGNWNSYYYGGRPIPSYGYATYRLRIYRNSQIENLAFKITHIRTAYQFYLNGIKIREIGRVGKSRQTSEARIFPNIIFADSKADTLEIILQVSNYDFRSGGISTSIVMGSVADITGLRQKNLLTAIFLLGGVLIVAFYHIGLFLLRRKDNSPLYFGLFALVFSLRILITNEYYLFHLFPHLGFEFCLKLEYLSMYVAYPLFLLFMRSLFREEFKKWYVQLIRSMLIIFPLFVIVTPVRINSHIVMPYQILIGLTTLYTFILIIRAYFRKVEGSQYVIWGTIILFICIFHDILSLNNIIDTGVLIQFGIYIFMFSQAFLLSSRSARAFQRSEELSAELNRINVNLEKIVDEKTKKLQNANVKIAQAYSQMRGQKDRLLHILHKPEIGFMLDKEGVILGVTDRAVNLTGIPRTEWIESNFSKYIRGHSPADFISMIRHALIEGQYQTEFALQTSRNAEISVLAVFTRLNKKSLKHVLMLLFELDEKADKNKEEIT